MRTIHPVKVSQLVKAALDDRKTEAQMMDEISIDKETIIEILTKHFEDMGVFMVGPMDQTETLLKSINFHLLHNADMIEMREKINLSRSKRQRKHR